MGNENPDKEPVEFLKLYNVDAKSYTSENPAIFETYPKEAVDMDLYYAASDIYSIENPGTTEASHGADIKILSWFNCYSFGQGVESNRIRDDFNQPIIDKNPVVSTVLDEAYGEELKATGLIFSQIFNSRSGVNRLNQFIQAEAITKDLNPAYTSIQKLYSRDTNLITLCEDKCLQILANKDALFNADGNVNITSNQAVLGQALPYAGEYGISKNPESFAAYGNRAYFTDKNRGVVLRLAGGLGGGQGLTEISAANLRDFFADNLHASAKLIGSYDDDKDQYNLTFDALTTEWSDKLKFNNTDIYSIPQTGTTVSWKEDVKGWTARKDYIPESAVSLNNTYYTFKNGKIWEHGASDAIRNKFYGREYDSAIRFIFNQEPASVKKFKTLNYSGSKSKEYRYKVQGKPEAQTFSLSELQSNTNYVPIAELNTEGWYTSLIKTNLQEGYIKQFKDKEGKFFNYIKGIGTQFNTNADNNLDSQEFSMQGIGRAIIGGDPQSAFNLTFKLDASCSVAISPPTAQEGQLTTIEDGTEQDGVLDLTTLTNDPQGLSLTYTLVEDFTANGTLNFNGTPNQDGSVQVTFVPNPDFCGDAGSFIYRVNNGYFNSNNAVVTVNVQCVNDGPVINSNPPVGPFYVGDVYTYSPITAVDPDHDPSEIAWSSNNLPSGWTLTTTGEGFTGNATVSGTLPIGNVTFDVTVTDPEGAFDTQTVQINSLSQVLQELLFVGRYTQNAVSQEVWTDPNTGYQTTVCGSPAGTSGGHTCGRGNFIIKANGVVIGSVNISNSQAGVYYDQNGNGISAGQQPTYNEPYNTTLNSAPSANDRYSSFQMDEATASQIAAAAPNGDITFTLECGSFEDPAGVTANCHSNALWFNIFRPGHPQYLCTAFSTFTSITINAFTGQIPQPY